jgi:probable phosphoglycerate mutase
MTVKKIYLFRHGETQWNVAGRMQGRLDSPLTDRGRQQALAHGRLVTQLMTPECCWVSSANRTRDTADLINRSLGVPLLYSDNLVERDCGRWSGKTLDEVRSEYPDDYSARNVDAYYHRPGGGENIPDLVERFTSLLDQWQQPECLGIVTHGVVSRAVLGYFLDLSADQVGQIKHPNALLYELSFEGNEVSVCHYWAELQSDGQTYEHSGKSVAGLCEQLPQQAQASE